MNVLLFLGLAASGASLYLEDARLTIGSVSILTNYLELLVVALILAEIIIRFTKSRWQAVFLRRHLSAILTGAGFLVLFATAKMIHLTFLGVPITREIVVLFVVRNLVLLAMALRRLKGLIDFVEYLRDHPAQTIVLSFLLVILSGTVLLMMPFTSSAGQGLSFVNALFTSTSAVCVTGLIVVDTATAFSIGGKVVILFLIQIGGLGIMILTFFTIFVLRRSVSLENKLLISYMLSERDMTQLRAMVLKIIGITLGIEAFGTVLLFIGFSRIYGYGGTALLDSVFHSVSAFCNAGFALFSESLVGFVSSPLISGTIAALIIVGGLSFVVLIDLGRNLSDRLQSAISGTRRKVHKLSLNTRVVLVMTTLLIVGGTLIIYGTEHSNSLKDYPLATQYFAAFFQSVTLRTAGFNTIPFGSLRNVTYLVMIGFMFIGGASGSTAGGIKVGTVAVIYSFLSAFFRNRKTPILFRQSISNVQILRSFTILLFGIVVVGLATILLSASEHDSTMKILFEATSAFGTVGLSTGITGTLSMFGRVLISLLMFTGRIGPLTVIAAASRDSSPGNVEFPGGEISIG